MDCELCRTDAGVVLYRDEHLRVVWIDDPDYPGFCRVIWAAHVREMTDLAPEQRAYLMEWVFRAERALCAVLAPDKVNLASLGNVVPHLHWHVIPRFADDATFPAPIWAPRQREGRDRREPDLAERLRAALLAQ